MAIIEVANPIAGGTGSVVQSQAVGEPAAGSATAVHAAVTDTGVPQTVTTGITNPDVARNVTATAGGTAGDIKAISVTVTGTDIHGGVISETLPAFTADSTGSVIGSKAFRTITSIAIPAHDGTGATTAIGTGAKLGLNTRLGRNTVVAAFLNGVRESTGPTVVTDAVNICGNTAALASTLNGNAVVLDFYDS